ncbi:MAG: ribosome biogenesis GTP-binding protein YihA/YsxC [Acidobacteria bacterium]|nr:ribosome biogenesis GTP-binding protein YihA/YsxC [Acidobacteriota bacterium]
MAILRITAAEFVTSAASAGDLLQTSLAELAIAGRSNVGKSTLINVLAGRTLARTSAAPGKTRLANYYRLQPSRGPAFHLVDLPGYGYARGARDGQTFDTLAREYFFGDVQGAWIRPAIAGVILLVDARHPGLDSDAEAFRWFGAQGCPLRLVATKADKLSRAERQRTTHALTRAFGTSALMVSAPGGEGIDELWTWIAQQLDQWTLRKP